VLERGRHLAGVRRELDGLGVRVGEGSVLAVTAQRDDGDGELDG
jgi:hypothetical protein